MPCIQKLYCTTHAEHPSVHQVTAMKNSNTLCAAGTIYSVA